VLWLENFLRILSGTILLVSHERDLLNNVVDTSCTCRAAS
jgi:ATP-binding cassette, subfamily F, member 3